MKGSQEVLNRLRVLIDKENLNEKIDLLATFCMSQCYKEGIGVKINDMYFNIMKEEADTFFYETIFPMVTKQ